MRKFLVRAAVVLVLVAGLAYLFMKTAQNVVSEPYTVRQEHLREWTIETNDSQNPLDGVVVLRPPHAMPAMVAQQVFLRRMESMITPNVHGIPLVLRSEFDGVFAAVASLDDLAAVAEEAGLRSDPFVATCLGARRAGSSDTGQIFFILFESPAFDQFRQGIGALLETRGGNRDVYDAAALRPLLVITASGRTLQGWIPTRQKPEEDCVAPVEFE
jgi:hypothetical protein